MSILVKESYVNPSTPLWAEAGSSGGGAVTSVSAGAGIFIADTTGAVIVENSGVTSLTAGPNIQLSSATGDVVIDAIVSGASVDTTLGYVADSTLTIPAGNFAILGDVSSTFVKAIGNYYVANLCIQIAPNVEGQVFDGTITAGLRYSNGDGPEFVALQSQYVNNGVVVKIPPSSYSTTLAFQHIQNGTLQIVIQNNMGVDADISWNITTFSVIDNGPVGTTAVPIFS